MTQRQRSVVSCSLKGRYGFNKRFDGYWTNREFKLLLLKGSRQRILVVFLVFTFVVSVCLHFFFAAIKHGKNMENNSQGPSSYKRFDSKCRA